MKTRKQTIRARRVERLKKFVEVEIVRTVPELPHRDYLETKRGELRVWNIVNPPNSGSFFQVQSPQEAIKLINSMADTQLQCPNITSNAFGLEVFEDGEWLEWYSGDGEDINEYEQSHLQTP